MSELQQTLDRLKDLPMFEAERPATKEEMLRIESELGVALPAQYVEFLQRHSYAGWFGHEILGIRPVNPETGQPSSVTSDCITWTNKERDPSNPFGTSSLPPDHVVVATDGGGGNFVLFTVGSPYEGQVHWYNFEDQGESIKTWQTFRDFLEYLIENAIVP